MSTAKRLVLSLRGRKDTQSIGGTSSTRLVAGTSPGHELEEIAIVSCGGESVQPFYSHINGPHYSNGM